MTTRGIRMLLARNNNIMLALILVLAACVAPANLQQMQQMQQLQPARDQRSIGQGPTRTAQRMMGGYMRINTITTADKSGQEMAMTMAGAGEGKDKDTKKDDSKDEDAKTLSDQVKEGKYGLLQDEIFISQPKRPGVLGYESNPETSSVDNNDTLGGLKNRDIWLSEGHLLVLKGGKYPPYGAKEPDAHWPAIDGYEAPRRQVKLPKKPKVPPPFPVQLKDGGPIVYITSEGGRIPAGPLGGLPPPFAPYSPYPFDPFQGDFTPGGAPYPFPPFPFPDFPRNQSEGGPGAFPSPFPFAPSINGSFAGLPPPPFGPPFGSPFPPQLPPLPPRNLTDDMFDEDDPSLYYPPPYSFSFKTANSTVPPGPLVPGIVLPPPPDFFELEDNTKKQPQKTTTHKTNSTPDKFTFTTVKPIPTKQSEPVKQIVPTLPPRPKTVFVKQRPKPIELTRGFVPIAVKNSRPLKDSPDNSIDITTTQAPRPFTVQVEPVPNYRRPDYSGRPDSIVVIPKPLPQKSKDYSISKPKPAVSIVYDIPDNYYNTNSVQSHKPFLVYGLPKGQVKQSNYGNSFVTTTPVPLHAYYGPGAEPRPQQQPQYFRQNTQYFRPSKPNSSPLTSYYFYDEVTKTTTAPPPYYSTRQKAVQNIYYDTNSQGYSPIGNIDYQPLNNQQGNSLYNLPPRQGSRTLTQEYFSVQKPTGQNNNYVSQLSTPDSFFKQIANIQQTIDLYTTPKPNTYYRPNYNVYKQPQPAKVRTSAKPVYQYSYQSQGLPQQNSFRAPIVDSEPFRPMISYSEPYDIKYQSTPKTTTFQQYLIETVNTERPFTNKYLSPGSGREYEYNEVPGIDTKQNTIKNTYENTYIYATEVNTPRTPVQTTTLSGIKDDLDEITRKYFTVFGQKLEGTSTPSPTIIESALENVINKEEKLLNSLAGDTLVNYRHPLPAINPDSEFIPIADPSLRARIEAERRFNTLRQQVESERQHATKQAQQSAKQAQQSAKLAAKQAAKQQAALAYELAEEFDDERHGAYAGDTAVNYRIPLPEINVESESVAASGDNAAGEGRPGSFVSYRLPGQGAHVYFLTPRAVSQGTQGIR